MDVQPQAENSNQTPLRPGALRGVLAFIFNPDFSQVLLILKNRPVWAKGKFNGVGGKHEAAETDQACASREVGEEAGIAIAGDAWTTVAHIEWEDWDGGVLATVWNGDLDSITSVTDEPVSWQPVANLPQNVMPNLRWLIPLAIDVLQEQSGDRQGRQRQLYIQAKYQLLFL